MNKKSISGILSAIIQLSFVVLIVHLIFKSTKSKQSIIQSVELVFGLLLIIFVYFIMYRLVRWIFKTLAIDIFNKIEKRKYFIRNKVSDILFGLSLFLSLGLFIYAANSGPKLIFYNISAVIFTLGLGHGVRDAADYDNSKD